jgi:hypothetical protein
MAQAAAQLVKAFRCDAFNQGLNPGVHNLWNKKVHSLRPIYSVDPTYGGRALMYGVAQSMYALQVLLKKNTVGWAYPGLSFFLKNAGELRFIILRRLKPG